jgi:hypothetical protein
MAPWFQLIPCLSNCHAWLDSRFGLCLCSLCSWRLGLHLSERALEIVMNRYWFGMGIVFCLFGCDSGEPTVSVQGRVFYRGAPLPAGTVVFAPDESRGTTGPLARGEVHHGTYELKSEDLRGAAPGWYRVTITAVEVQSSAMDYGRGPAVVHSILPDRYRDPELSGLHCNVKSDQDNVIDFNLE